MTTSPVKTFDAQATAALLDYPALVQMLRETIVEYAAGKIVSPERLVIPLQEGGVMLSMPSSASDIAIHKLVNVCPGNGKRQLPTIHGQVIACDAFTGEMLFVLDGPTVTGRRTAAVSALGIMCLHAGAPEEILIIGTGKQAVNHVEAFAALFPQARMLVKGSTPERAQRFAESLRAMAPNLGALDGDVPDSVDVVVTVTTSQSPVYTAPARAGRLVVGVGAFTPVAAEVGKTTVDGSFVVVDDPAGARHEAGDLIQAGFDWTNVNTLADAIEGSLAPAAPVFFKSVGCAAWDLAACRVARARIGHVA
ncbi:bifunctional Delta(1)-pyrroline-2-carboxylate/Delta(1)-piperideine-2-carboxylate reductase [Paraburkholderia sacchari]|uniref:bifunctional Delta(1)-pyrroline-2-carboxylate/Delta(1)-piperideine-2- carboxylate reductase n=1 Tax=Paraburkholderia sacchari TaxID=159450 RepID=UPI000543C0D9|nr:bifunctional Delta(1)-pyrroline-2-carboxylate/Delta(1)-piperideine-2-carboxylate reductase [Paraburkholderia sacchari]NLP63579.1 delta(1)-pyrroline-2-carboxylate reductase family protein [Paraburkholderia sacchari]